tara:strand:+ start:658 stop:1686 length:1029 start_codon:yes stop_codon:yes gene_type:complete
MPSKKSNKGDAFEFSFNLDIFQLNIFTKFFKNICTLTKILQLDVRPTGIFCQSLDDTHCVLFHFELKNTWFKNFFIKEGRKKVSVSLECNYISKVLNCANSSTREVRIGQKSNDMDHINIMIYNHENYEENENIYCTLREKNIKKKTKSNDLNNSDKEFNLVLIDYSNEPLHIPAIEFDIDITVCSSGLQKIFGEIDCFGEDLNVLCDEDKIIFKTSGDMGNYSVQILEEHIEEYSIVEDSVFQTTFGMTIINKITKFLNMTSFVYIKFVNNNPSLILIPLEPKKTSIIVESDSDDNNDDNDDNVEEKNTKVKDEEENEEEEEDEEPDFQNFLKFYIAPKIE